MVDEELKEKFVDLIEDGELTPEHIIEFMGLFCQICEENEEIQEEIEGWDRVFQMKMEGAQDFWLKVEGGKFSMDKGNYDGDPDVTLEMDGDTAAGIFTGEIDATSAYMNNDLKIVGPLPDAVKFRTLTELVRDDLED